MRFGFLPQFHLGFRAYGQTATRGKLCSLAPHSHSIVSGTCNSLNCRNFHLGCAELTVTSTAKNSRLRAIDGDRSG